jgi:hypothetical protein
MVRLQARFIASSMASALRIKVDLLIRRLFGVKSEKLDAAQLEWKRPANRIYQN